MNSRASKGSAGASVMPQRGQAPGVRDTTSGCMGHMYAGGAAVCAAPAMPHTTAHTSPASTAAISLTPGRFPGTVTGTI